MAAETTTNQHASNHRRFQRQSLSRSRSSSVGKRESNASSTNENDTLYSRSSRRELRSVRAKQQRRATARDVESSPKQQSTPKRSFSADYRFALDESTADEDVTLDIQRNAPSGGVKLELRMRDDLLQRGGSKKTLDELLRSHHPKGRHNRRRQRLTARGTRDRWELRKSLSYGQMQDLTRTLSQTDLHDLKQSLHGVQERRKLQSTAQLAEKLADMFEEALQHNDPPQESIIPQIRKQIMELTVDNMATLVQHLDQCQAKKEPVQWTFLQPFLDPERTLDWDNEIFQPMTKSASQASGLGRQSDHDVDDESTWTYEEESSMPSNESSFYLMSDNGEAGFGYDPTDDDSDITGYSLDGVSDSCDSSITIEEFWSHCDPEDSFAIDMPSEGVAEDCDTSIYEVVEESFVMEESVYLEESVVLEESVYMEQSVHTVEPTLLVLAGEEEDETDEEDLFCVPPAVATQLNVEAKGALQKETADAASQGELAGWYSKETFGSTDVTQVLVKQKAPPNLRPSLCCEASRDGTPSNDQPRAMILVEQILQLNEEKDERRRNREPEMEEAAKSYDEEMSSAVQNISPYLDQPVKLVPDEMASVDSTPDLGLETDLVEKSKDEAFHETTSMLKKQVEKVLAHSATLSHRLPKPKSFRNLPARKVSEMIALFEGKSVG